MMMLLNYAIKLMIGTHTHTHLHSIQTVMIEQKPSCCELVSLFIADRKITLCSDLDFCKNDSFPELIFLMKNTVYINRFSTIIFKMNALFSD